MAITQTMCTSFKKEILQAVHNFSAAGGHTFKIALYTSSATIGADTTAFTTSGEASGTAYVSGGFTLTNVEPSSGGTTGFCDFEDAYWNSSSITARGALIYNSSQSNKAVCVLDFGSDITSNPDFRIRFPVNDADTAVIRIT
tara:strand:- start:589 stop:1014 length:426 start_codon:yes stop_codon:yes gene_type:complete